MATFLFLINPTFSHVNSSMTFARSLETKKHQVIFALPDIEVKKHVTTNGFKTLIVNSVPFGLNFELILNKIKKSSTLYLDVLIDKLNHTVYKQRKTDLSAILNKHNFTHLVLDSFYSSDLIVLHEELTKRKIKIIFLQTWLSSSQHRMSPPLNSGQPALSPFQTNFLWQLYYLQRSILRFFKKILFFGRDDWSVIKQKFKESRLIQMGVKLNRNSILPCAFEGLPELITSPIELEYFDVPQLKSQQYLGLCIDPHRREDFYDVDFPEFFNKYSESAHERKIIYCAFGGRFEEYEAKVRTIVEKLIHIASSRPDMIFVFAIKHLKSSCSNTGLSNVHIFERVPQMKMLSISRVFISHGGINSIKESIYFKVPMMIFPIETSWDQPGNAARVQSLKIGVKASHRTSQAKIRSQIDDLVDQSMYSENVAALKAKIERNSNQSDTEKIIQSVL